MPMQIQDISVHDSTLSFMYIGALTGVPTTNNSIAISNIIISDCLVPQNINMILIDKLQSNYEFNIHFQNFTFKNIKFTLGGNLMKFSHLLPNSITVTNSSFSNITAGRIDLESYTANINKF